LYLAALPVTFERFAFAAHLEALNTTIREWAGAGVIGRPAEPLAKQHHPGGDQALLNRCLTELQLSNQTIINLTGNLKHTVSESTLMLNLAQPLLRGGGRAVTLDR